MRGFFTNPSRADDSFIPFKIGVNNANFISSDTGANSTLSVDIAIPSDCNHAILNVMVKQGYNGGYLTNLSFNGDISNIKTVVEENKYQQNSNPQLLIYEFDTIPGGNINVNFIGNSNPFLTCNTLLLY